MLKILAPVDSRSFPPAPGKAAPLEMQDSFLIRALSCNEALFTQGDVKTNLYRIESGGVCIYRPRPDGQPEIIEFAFAGDVVGMGFLERHACTARAMVDTRVTCLPLDAADRLAEHDARTASRFSDAVEREFAFRRHSLVEAGHGRPIVRVAAFLLALSRRNSAEGRNPNVIDDALACSVVADHLGLSLDLLELTLVQLKMQGMVQAGTDHDLLLTDLDGLETLTNVGSASGTRREDCIRPDDLPGDPSSAACGTLLLDATPAPLCYSRSTSADEIHQARTSAQTRGVAVILSVATGAAAFLAAHGGWGM